MIEVTYKLGCVVRFCASIQYRTSKSVRFRSRLVPRPPLRRTPSVPPLACVAEFVFKKTIGRTNKGKALTERENQQRII